VPISRDQESAMFVSLLRKRSRSLPNVINALFCHSTMTGQGPRCCTGLLTITGTSPDMTKIVWRNRASLRSASPERSEQFRSAIFLGLCDHDGRDEHFFSLFQVL